MGVDTFKRYRFSVPNADKSVTDWIEAQSNLSYSIRELIKTAIRCNGFADVACYPVRQIMQAGGFSMEMAMMAQANGGQFPAPAINAPGGAPQGQPPYPSGPAQPAAPSYPSGPAPSAPGQAYPQTAAPAVPTPAPVAAPVPTPAPAPGYAQPSEPVDEQVFADPAVLLNGL